MILEDRFIIHAPVDVVWAYLNDIPKVSACMPGVEDVRALQSDVYQATMRVKVGPVNAAFTGKASLVDRSTPGKFAARIEGNDKNSASSVSATFSAELAPQGEDTRVAYKIDFTLRGRLAQFGLAAVQGTAKQMTVEFARCLQDALSQTRRVVIVGREFADLSIESEELRGLDVEFSQAPVKAAAQPVAAVELDNRIKRAHVILAGPGISFSPLVIRQLTHCQAIISYDPEAANVDVRAATQQGILVAAVPDTAAENVATHTLALILASVRKILPAHRAAMAGNWNLGGLQPISSTEGLTLGIIGYGKAGQAVHRKAVPFGFEVLVYDPLQPAERIAAAGAEPVSLDVLLSRSDVITLHAPLTGKSYGMIDEAALEKMKPSAYLVNTSRSELVDEAALEKALLDGRIAGAALDGPGSQPGSPEQAILKSERLLVTPKMAGYSEQSAMRQRLLAVQEAARVVRGERPHHLINPEVFETKDRPAAAGVLPIRWPD